MEIEWSSIKTEDGYSAIIMIGDFMDEDSARFMAEKAHDALVEYLNSNGVKTINPEIN